MKRVLCNYKDDRVEVHVSAEIKGGKLVLSGHDLGKVVDETFGDSDYEYWYSLDAGNLDALRSSFEVHTDEQVLDTLQAEFSGLDGCKRFREYCESNSISLAFFSY